MAYPFLVDVAWKVVEQFGAEWRSQPYRWERERDLQVALASRLDSALRVIGYATVAARYPGAPERRHYNRVGCEPRVHLSGRDAYCFPDIVLFKDLPEKDIDDPPDACNSWRGNWPMHWACELKFDDAKKLGAVDEEKLRRLIKDGDLDFGCILDVRREDGDTSWKAVETGNSLWRFSLRVPPLRTGPDTR